VARLLSITPTIIGVFHQYKRTDCEGNVKSSIRFSAISLIYVTLERYIVAFADLIFAA